MKRTSYGRQGYSLIEMLILMSIISTLMSINAIWIGKSLQFSSAMRERHQDHLNLTRLSNELRSDVARANKWSMLKPDELSLEYLDGARVRYKFEAKSNGSMVRSERLEKAASEGNVVPEVADPKTGAAQTGADTSREQFKLSRSCELHLDTTDFPRSLSIVVYRVPNIPNPPPGRDSSARQGDSVSPGSGSVISLSTDLDTERPIETVIKLVPNRWSLGEQKKE